MIAAAAVTTEPVVTRPCRNFAHGVAADLHPRAVAGSGPSGIDERPHRRRRQVLRLRIDCVPGSE